MAASFLLRYQERVAPHVNNQCGTGTVTETRKQRDFSDNVVAFFSQSVTNVRREQADRDCAALCYSAVPTAMPVTAAMTGSGTRTRETRDCDAFQRQHLALPIESQ